MKLVARSYQVLTHVLMMTEMYCRYVLNELNHHIEISRNLWKNLNMEDGRALEEVEVNAFDRWSDLIVFAEKRKKQQKMWCLEMRRTIRKWLFVRCAPFSSSSLSASIDLWPPSKSNHSLFLLQTYSEKSLVLGRRFIGNYRQLAYLIRYQFKRSRYLIMSLFRLQHRFRSFLFRLTRMVNPFIFHERPSFFVLIENSRRSMHCSATLLATDGLHCRSVSAITWKLWCCAPWIIHGSNGWLYVSYAMVPREEIALAVLDIDRTISAITGTVSDTFHWRIAVYDGLFILLKHYLRGMFLSLPM